MSGRLISFRDIVGHGTALEALERAFTGNRGHHAYLFTGPSGVGKRTVAEVMAGSLLCERGRVGAPCGHCGSCRRVSAGSHADWRSLAPDADRIKIADVRELNHEFAFGSFEGGARVVLIDDAERFTPEAANALLKTLEEPPPRSYFFLITSNHAQLLPTVVSRCQHVPFVALSPSEVEQVVSRVEAEEGALDNNLLEVAARFSGGSPGHALALIEDPVFARRPQLVREFLALTSGETANPTAFGDWAELPDPRPSDGRSKLARQRDLTRSVLESLKVTMRDVMLVRSDGALERLVNADLASDFSRYSGELTWDRISAMLRAVRDAEEAVAGNVPPRLVLETLGVRVADLTATP